jgi:hypothetical protein
MQGKHMIFVYRIVNNTLFYMMITIVISRVAEVSAGGSHLGIACPSPSAHVVGTAWRPVPV